MHYHGNTNVHPYIVARSTVPTQQNYQMFAINLKVVTNKVPRLWKFCAKAKSLLTQPTTFSSANAVNFGEIWGAVQKPNVSVDVKPTYVCTYIVTVTLYQTLHTDGSSYTTTNKGSFVLHSYPAIA